MRGEPEELTYCCIGPCNPCRGRIPWQGLPKMLQKLVAECQDRFAGLPAVPRIQLPAFLRRDLQLFWKSERRKYLLQHLKCMPLFQQVIDLLEAGRFRRNVFYRNSVCTLGICIYINLL